MTVGCGLRDQLPDVFRPWGRKRALPHAGVRARWFAAERWLLSRAGARARTALASFLLSEGPGGPRATWPQGEGLCSVCCRSCSPSRQGCRAQSWSVVGGTQADCARRVGRPEGFAAGETSVMNDSRIAPIRCCSTVMGTCGHEGHGLRADHAYVGLSCEQSGTIITIRLQARPLADSACLRVDHTASASRLRACILSRLILSSRV